MLKVGGLDDYLQLNSKPNDRVDGREVITAPFYSSFDVYNLLSYSIYHNHSVWVTEDGVAHCIGDNTDGQINPALPKMILKEDTTLKNYKYVSAVCGSNYTLYMTKDESTNQFMLLYCYAKKNKSNSQLLLNIGFRKPLALFGGDLNCAAIDTRGAIILVNASVFDSPKSAPIVCILPENEKAISVACCNKMIFVLSQNGDVYKANFSMVSKEQPSFEKVSCFVEKVANISGTREHCFAVTKSGKVYGIGFNSNGQLGINESSQKFDQFIYINSLGHYNIVNAYAGYVHSFFQTAEGTVLACGKPSYSCLLINDPTLKDSISTPRLTEIKNSASFCIAGNFVSAVFIGCKSPKAMPNKALIDYKFSQPKSKEENKNEILVANVELSDKFNKKESYYIETISSLNKQIENQSTQIIEYGQKEKKYLATINNLQNEIKIQSVKIKHSSEKIAQLNDEIQTNRTIVQLQKQLQKSSSANCQQMMHKSQNLKEVKREDYIINDKDEANHEVLSELNNGYTSVSFKINDTKTNQLMCKEIISIEKHQSTKRKIQNAAKEFETIFKLTHPCICKAYGINDAEIIFDEEKKEEITTIAIFTEFIDYKLKDCLEKEIINNTLKTRIVLEIAHAMNYLHKNGFIHRELNIDHIMLDSIFESKIIHCGLQKIKEIMFDLTTLSLYSKEKQSGYYEFMSPELINEEDVTYKTDVYSFGIIVYYLFVGKLPQQSLAEKTKKVPIKLPEASDSISQFCINLISKCVSINPDDRPSFEKILEELKSNSYELASEVNKKIISKRNQELDMI